MIKSIRLLGLSALLSVSFSLTLWGQTQPIDTDQKLVLFSTVFEKIRSQYVEPVNDQELIEAAIEGMVSSLDPHSDYVPEQKQSPDDNPEETYGGIGATIKIIDGWAKITETIEDFPAFRAGIQPNDVITKIDRQEIHNLPLDQVINKIRGPINTAVVISIQRGEQPVFELELKREKIQLKIVTSRLEQGNIAYIQITTFNGEPYKKFVEQLNQLKAKAGSNLIGVILDLRGNLGGEVEEAVSVADAFLEKGQILSIVSPHQQHARDYQAKPGDMIDGLPLILLVNEKTASAPEMLAVALQDQGRAIIMGVRTYGKATVWDTFPIKGYGNLELTTGFAYGPSGKSWQIRGIQPDIIVEQGTFTPDPVSREYTEETYPNALKNPNGETVPTSPAAIASNKRMKDNQLQQALNLLEAIHILNQSH